MSCSGLDVPNKTELTPSFRRHHAGKRKKGCRSHGVHLMAHFGYYLK